MKKTHAVLLLTESQRRSLGEEVRKRGLQPVARELGIPRTTLSSVIAGSCRRGSEALAALAIERRRMGLIAASAHAGKAVTQ
jgi:hypothetical protein